MEKSWFIYKLSNLSLHGWRSFGVKHEQIKDNRDISALARAVKLLEDCFPEIDWFNQYHEFWVLECPCEQPFVCVRPNTNPYEAGYIVSPIKLSYLPTDEVWERKSK